jgi:cytochrome c oxidase cbb3-type subunit 3
MAIGERDPHTGHMTTGHEWNGITELNTPVPRIVYFFLAVTALFSLVYWVLMPAWPTGATYTKGLLGLDQRTTVARNLEQAAADRAAWTSRIADADYKDIQADPALMSIVRRDGRRLFGDNCAVCHGTDARGSRGFPNLTSGSWLWGGDPQTIAETLRVGINAAHEETRVSQMPGFGQLQMLPPADIDSVVSYVRSLSDPAAVVAGSSDKIAAGKAVFADNCSACHGDDAKGKREVGAPSLVDGGWIYGGDEDSIFGSVYNGRQGHMPRWEGRLTPVDRKILTLYVLDRGATKN